MTRHPNGSPGGETLVGFRQRPLIVQAFAIALAGLLAGYMFMGRGFAHIQFGPVYIGDVVLFLGIVTAAVVLFRRRARPQLNWSILLLVAFMGLGAARTIPYLPTYGMDALRDGTLWGYAVFALIVYLLADVQWLRLASRVYAWVVPVFAFWLPICLTIFVASQRGIDPTRPGSNTPLVFFKAGDMTVHAAGAIALLVLAPGLLVLLRAAIVRFVVLIPLAWTMFITGAVNRGSILTAVAGLGVAALATRRRAHWVPVMAAAIVVVVVMNAGSLIPTTVGPGPTPTPGVLVSPSMGPSAPPLSTPSPGVTSAPVPTQPAGRSASGAQWLDNIGSIFGSTSIGDLEGTRAFRLAWWTKIVDYTVFGPYFWSGKGFGINLADVDGFQPTADNSLRAPHNSHMTVLARMGVPGAVLWGLFQASFAIGLIWAIRAHRRRQEAGLAAIGAWVLVMWAAMMTVTSFDPYLEGPQGGIWFWVVIGIGMVVTKLARSEAQS